METIPVKYRFTLANGARETIDLYLDRETLQLQNFTPDVLPPWTKLDYYQCHHCPFTVAEQPDCPVAANLVPNVLLFEKLLSYDEIHVDIITREREISQDTTAQRAISALMGLVMATSGCPHMSFFKPMARFHLPLASEKDITSEISLDGLTTIYRNIQIVNTTIAKRIRASSVTDSSVNALVLLDMNAKSVAYEIKDHLEDIRYLFNSFYPQQ